MKIINIILSFMSFMVMNAISSAMFIFTTKNVNSASVECTQSSSSLIIPRATCHCQLG